MQIVFYFMSFNVEAHLKLLISQSKFSGPRKFTLKYQYFELSGFDILTR